MTAYAGPRTINHSINPHPVSHARWEAARITPGPKFGFLFPGLNVYMAAAGDQVHVIGPGWLRGLPTSWTYAVSQATAERRLRRTGATITADLAEKLDKEWNWFRPLSYEEGGK